MQRCEWNWWLIASAVLGMSYWLVAGQPSHGPLLVAWKGSGVALLAVAALVVAVRHRDVRFDAALLTAVLALEAAGDVIIEYSLIAGAVAFLCGHMIACVLFSRNLRNTSSIWNAVGIVVPLIFIPDIGRSLSGESQIFGPHGIYTIGLAVMVALAWLSCFPRNLVALGAWMFAVSDLLIFARTGPLAGSMIPNLLVWPLYYFGQFLICTGVLAGLNRRRAV